MKLIRLIGIFLFLFFTLNVSAHAAKVGLNIAGRYEDIGTATQLVGPGGWIVMMGNPDPATAERIRTIQAAGVNVVIRASHGSDTPFSKNLAGTWADFFKNNAFTERAYFMPLNEPNNDQEGLDCTNAGMREYVAAVPTEFTAKGVRCQEGKPGGVCVLAPAFDAYRLAAENNRCVAELGGAAVLNSYDGIPFHAYGKTDNTGTLKTAHPFMVGDVSAFLSSLGLPPDKPVFVLETGISCDGCGAEDDVCGFSPGSSPPRPVEIKYPFTQSCAQKFLNYFPQVLSKWANIVMMSPLDYDPPDYGKGPWIHQFGTMIVKELKGLFGGGAETPDIAGTAGPGVDPGSGSGSTPSGPTPTPTPASPCTSGTGYTCEVADKANQAVPYVQAPTEEACNVFESILSYFGIVDCKLNKVEDVGSPQATIKQEEDKGIFESIADAWSDFSGKTGTIKNNLTPYSVAGASTEGETDAEVSSERASCEALNAYSPYSMRSACEN